MKARQHIWSLIPVTVAILLSGCEREAPQPAASPSASSPDASEAPAAEPTAPTASTPEPAAKAIEPLNAALVLREWGKAENRESCAPLAFTSVGGASGTARRARFSGGWGIAYDQAGVHSAYGLAGAGLIDQDHDPVPDQRAYLARQWPLFRDVANLPSRSFAGYGVEGAKPYPDNNPSGKELNSLAYLRVGGQVCTYNVWSRLGRAHLEYLLEHLTLIQP
jgi:hypothetical protein